MSKANIPKFIKIGDGKCEMGVRLKKGSFVTKVTGGTVYYAKLKSISYVTKENVQGDTVFSFYSADPNFYYCVSCTGFDTEYEKYVTNTLLNEHVDNEHLAAISGHLETLLVAAGQRETTDEPLFDGDCKPVPLSQLGNL